jgi:hypothetical protein
MRCQRIAHSCCVFPLPSALVALCCHLARERLFAATPWIGEHSYTETAHALCVALNGNSRCACMSVLWLCSQPIGHCFQRLEAPGPRHALWIPCKDCGRSSCQEGRCVAAKVSDESGTCAVSLASSFSLLLYSGSPPLPVVRPFAACPRCGASRVLNRYQSHIRSLLSTSPNDGDREKTERTRTHVRICMNSVSAEQLHGHCDL